MARIKGLELLFSATKGDLKSKEDCAVAAIHCLITNSDLLCVGVGEVFSDNDAETATELLPDKWNADQNLYRLRYRCKDLKKCYLLQISKTGCNLHIAFGTVEDQPSSVTVNTSDFVSDDFGTFSQAYKKLDELKSQVKKKIIKNVVEAKKTSSSSPEKESSKKKTSPKNGPNQEQPKAEIPKYQPVPIGVPNARHPGGGPYAFPQIGARDLDPFAGGGGGMFFDPFAPDPISRGRDGRGNTGLPPGAVPPGARFDPFSPIDPGRYNPNPDHFRPPDYGNMFM